MPSDDVRVQIGAPRPERPGESVDLKRRSFLVSGNVTGWRTKDLSATLTKLDVNRDVTNQIVARVVFIQPVQEPREGRVRGEGSLYRWALQIDTGPAHVQSPLPAGDYRLTITPDAHDGVAEPMADSIRITLPEPDVAPPEPDRKLGVLVLPTIEYPPGGSPYVLTPEELDFFYTTGNSDVAVTDVTLSGISANYVAWVPELHYWVAEFLYVRDTHGEGSYKIFVTNEDGTQQRRVVVDL